MTSAAPGSSLTDVPVIFEIRPSSNFTMRKRQSGTFIGDNNPASFSLAQNFTINADGTLEDQTDAFVSTNEPGATYQPFGTSSAIGNTATFFSVVIDVLTWSNPAFVGGEAFFCTDTYGSTYAVFDGVPPPGCGPINLNVIAATACSNGVITTAPPGASTSTAPANNNLGATLVLLPDLYNFEQTIPAGDFCRTVDAIWVEGATTILTEYPVSSAA